MKVLAKQLELATQEFTTMQEEVQCYLKSQSYDEYTAWMNTVK